MQLLILHLLFAQIEEIDKKKNLLQVQKSYSISLSEHFQIHSSASLGDLMIFAREMI